MAQNNQNKQPEMIKCEVLRGIGTPPDESTLEVAKERAKRKNIKFDPSGLTTMVYPEKDRYEENGKTLVKAKPVFVELEVSVAKKLQQAGAVRRAID